MGGSRVGGIDFAVLGRGERNVRKSGLFLGTGILLVAAISMGGDLGADEIMDRVRSNRASRTAKATIRMTLIDAHRRKLGKEFVVWREIMGGSSRTLIRFKNPPDVRGTSFLVLQESGKEERTYVKFPESPKLQLITSSQRKDSFMGSDFSYGDFRIEEKGEDVFKLIGSESIKGIDCHIIQSTPKNLEDAQYSKVILWVDKKKFVAQKTEFYDKKGNTKKRLVVNEVKLIENTWTATHSTMTDLSENHQTILEILEVTFKVEFPPDFFTRRTLMRGM